MIGEKKSKLKKAIGKQAKESAQMHEMKKTGLQIEDQP